MTWVFIVMVQFVGGVTMNETWIMPSEEACSAGRNASVLAWQKIQNIQDIKVTPCKADEKAV